MSERHELTGPQWVAARTSVNEVLRDWSTSQAEEILLDENGEAAIGLREDLMVSIQLPEGSSRVLAFAPIAPLPDDYDARLAVIEESLKFNLVQQTLGGGAIGLDPDGGALFFTDSAPVEAFERPLLEAILKTATATVLELREQIGFDPAAEAAAMDDGGDADEGADHLLRV